MTPAEMLRQSQRRLSSLAVALVTGNSKSASVTLEDYISLLRASITKGERRQSYIDSVAFWKDAHTKSEAAQTTLRDRVFELEVQNEELRGQLKETLNLTPENDSQRKRKRDGHDQVRSPSERRRKHPKSASASSTLVRAEVKINLIVDELEVMAPSTTANRHMRHLHTLHRLTAQKKPNSRDLASVLVQLTAVIIEALSARELRHLLNSGDAAKPTASVTRDQLKNATQIQSKVFDDYKSLLQVLFRTFLYILKGLDKLTNDAEGAILQAQVVYNIVKLFREAFDLIATYDSLDNPSKAVNKGRGGAKRTVHTAWTVPYPRDFRMPTSRFLVTMTASLNTTKAAPSQKAHQHIFEGFMHILLGKVGQGLQLFVFEDGKGDDLGGTTAEIGCSGGDIGYERKMAMLEASAPFLIWILERAIILLNRSMERMKAPTDERLQSRGAWMILPSKNGRLPTPNKGNLAEWAKTKLQNTLLEAVFGGDDKVFADSLNEPVDPEIDLDSEIAVTTEDDMANWFKQEVWRLVGWDRLGSCVSWDQEGDNSGHS